MKKRNRGDLWGQVSACNSDNKKRMVPFSIFLALKIVRYVCNDLKMWTEIPQKCAVSDLLFHPWFCPSTFWTGYSFRRKPEKLSEMAAATDL